MLIIDTAKPPYNTPKPFFIRYMELVGSVEEQLNFGRHARVQIPGLKKQDAEALKNFLDKKIRII